MPDQLSLTELMHPSDFDPDPEPTPPRCILCNEPEREGDLYGPELWTGAWEGGRCTRCYLGAPR